MHTDVGGESQQARNARVDVGDCGDWMRFTSSLAEMPANAYAIGMSQWPTSGSVGLNISKSAFILPVSLQCLLACLCTQVFNSSDLFLIGYVALLAKSSRQIEISVWIRIRRWQRSNKSIHLQIAVSREKHSKEALILEHSPTHVHEHLPTVVEPHLSRRDVASFSSVTR
jgi:hypothetical protein